VDVRINGNKPEFSPLKELMSIPQDMDLISILADVVFGNCLKSSL
jgi:hypothetical protein